MAQEEGQGLMRGETRREERTDWAKIWQGEWTRRWDYLCEVVFAELAENAGGLAGKSVAELGSGSGRVSRACSGRGAAVTLMDTSCDIMAHSRKLFTGDVTAKPKFVVGAFPRLPFKGRVFDVAWNAGVVEHFAAAELAESLKEMARVCKPGGLVVSINPNRMSLLHALGVRVLRAFKRYPYVDEEPIGSLVPTAYAAGLEPVRREYSSGFFLLFVGAFKRLGLFRPLAGLSSALFWGLSALACSVSRSAAGPAFRAVDRSFSRVFGGYVLVSVFRKKP